MTYPLAGRITMRRCLLSCLVLVATVSPLLAATKQLMITNRSGDAMTGIVISATATPDLPLAITGTFPMANGTTQMLTVTLPDGACVFDATYGFQSTPANKQPDLDICQLDGLVVE
jgi:hypothetical protein